jgi:ABC-type transport system substrate-binding protein
MDKRIYVMLVLFAIAVLLLVPCVLSQEYDKEVGGSMKVLESNLTDTFDPYTTRKLQGHRLAELLYCGLFQEEAQGSYYNVLADTSWFDSTGTYIAFYVRLKKGLRWIEYDSDVEDIVDTAQVTAHDVKFTYDMILSDKIEFSKTPSTRCILTGSRW